MKNIIFLVILISILFFGCTEINIDSSENNESFNTNKNSLPQVSSQETFSSQQEVIDCKTNFECFKEAILECNEAKFSSTLLGNEYVYEINENCSVSGTYIQKTCEINNDESISYLENFVDVSAYCNNPISFYTLPKTELGFGGKFDDGKLEITIMKFFEKPDDDFGPYFDTINNSTSSLPDNWEEEYFFFGIKNTSLKPVPISYSILSLVKGYSDNEELEFKISGTKQITSGMGMGKLTIENQIAPEETIYLIGKIFLPNNLDSTKIEYYGLNPIGARLPKAVIDFE